MGKTKHPLIGVLGIICLTFLGTACEKHAPVADCNPPAWFFESGDRDGFKTGVGEGENLEESAAAAMSEISAQISTWVSSRSMTLAERSGSTSESRFKHQVKLESQHRLKNAKRLNMAVCGKRYYVQYSVDLRPPELVMADALASEYPGEKIFFTGSPALTSSSFAETVMQISSHQKLDSSKRPETRIPLSLTFTDGIWCVHAGRVSLPVSDVSELVNVGVYVTESVKLGLCDRTGAPCSLLMKTGDEVFFSISGGAGFFSIFNTYADGRVSVIAANQPMAEGGIIYPDPSGRQVLQASTIEPGSASVDIYLLVVSPSRLDMTSFSALKEDGRTVSGDDSFSTHVLARWLDGLQKKQVAMLKTRTEPR
ncbi:MAG: hypothetical protein WC799_16710 [Desulfobacteraceae bacterium]|jgi:hypothetical protein